MRHILLVTETSDLAADLLVLRAGERGLPLYRLNLDEFPQRVSIGWFKSDGVRFAYDGQIFGTEDIGGAWFRRMPRWPGGDLPEERFIARESAAFLFGALETTAWFWMNAPSATQRAEHKLLQLREAERAGLDVPATVAGNDPAAARRLAGRDPIVVKTVAGGRVTVDGVAQTIFTSAVKASDLSDDDALHACPAIFQERVVTAFDLRVTVVQDQVFPARISITDRRPADLDWRQVDSNRIRYDPWPLPADFARRCIDLVGRMGLSYGALDFVVTEAGDCRFLEVNPAGQWGWIERATGLPITDAILGSLGEQRT